MEKQSTCFERQVLVEMAMVLAPVTNTHLSTSFHFVNHNTNEMHKHDKFAHYHSCIIHDSLSLLLVLFQPMPLLKAENMFASLCHGHRLIKFSRHGKKKWSEFSASG